MECSGIVTGNLAYPHSRQSPRHTAAIRSTLSTVPSDQGFGLTDTLLTLSIAGILLGMGVPALHGLVLNNRLTTEVNAFMAVLHTARSEAIKRGAAVTICKSPDGANCSEDGEWRDGWILFDDPNTNQAVDEDETVIRSQQGGQGLPALRYGGSKLSYDYVTYYPEGYARPNATFTFCDSRGSAKAKAIFINSVGRARSASKNSDNKPLDCSWSSP